MIGFEVGSAKGCEGGLEERRKEGREVGRKERKKGASWEVMRKRTEGE